MMSKSKQRLDYLKDRRSKVCDYCGKPREIAGYCRSCWEKRTKRRKARMAEKKLRGECINCPNTAVFGKVKCQLCLDKYNNQRALREESRRLSGKCIHCSEPSAGGPSGFCSVCFVKHISGNHFKSISHADALLDIFHKQGGLCPYTGNKLILGNNASLDHIVPVSQGGSNDASNLQWVYSWEWFDVNKMKWGMTDQEFRKAIVSLHTYVTGGDL